MANTLAGSYFNKQTDGLQYPPKITLCCGKSVNNERRGENWVHTWFFKQKESELRHSQGVSLFRFPWAMGSPPEKISSATLRSSVLTEKKLFPFQLSRFFLFSLESSPGYLLFCITPLPPKKTLPRPRSPPRSFFPHPLLVPFPFFVPRICLPNVLCCSHPFFYWTPSAATFLSALLLLQPPFFCLCPYAATFCPTLSTASKSEANSLWPLRMRHVTHWDSGTWLRMWSARTNNEKVTHA